MGVATAMSGNKAILPTVIKQLSLVGHAIFVQYQAVYEARHVRGDSLFIGRRSTPPWNNSSSNS